MNGACKDIIDYSMIPVEDRDWIQEMDWIKHVFDCRFNWNADVAF